MKNKATLTDKIDGTQLLIDSIIKGINNNTISKDEIVVKLVQVYKSLEFIESYISIEHDDF
jgi:hypothetical protein